MNQIVTNAIVLARTDYGEADRILTLLTPDHGKLRLLAKGVRRIKSKLAGGIELFSVSTITYVKGRGEIGTLVSTRLIKYYAHIVQDLDRTMLGYELLKQLNKITEDEPEPEYFDLMQQALEALDDPEVPIDLVRVWFLCQLLRLGGHTPNLVTDIAGRRLQAHKAYSFDFDRMAFAPSANGRVNSDQIKLLRLIFDRHTPKSLAHIGEADKLAQALAPLIQGMAQAH